MAKSKENNKKYGIIIFTIIMLVLTIFIVGDNYYKNKGNNGNLYALSYDTSEYIYLSDIDYMDESFVEDGYYIRKDKNASSGLITLNIEGEKKEFIKGISAWASSSLVYDLTNLDYDYFTAYLGVDAKETSTYYNSGVIFSIYTSTDNITYDEVYTSKILKGFDDAEEVKIDISNANYIKLYAYENGDSWYSMWYDDAVYADAKFIKADYEGNQNKTFNIIKKVNEYDDLIKSFDASITSGDFNNIDTYELTLLQREFVKNAKYDILQQLLNYSDEYSEVLSWLLNDKETLELYVLGGRPDGNYATSLQVLNELYKTYKDDLLDKTKLANGDTLGNLYRKMMVSLSLTHSASVGLWVSGAPEDVLDPNGSNALTRYKIYKTLYLNNKLDKNIFENLSVEEMRYVMNNIIDDEEIIWLNDYTTLKNSRNPYSYITYRFGYDYTKDIYYTLDNQDKWDQKYNNYITDYNITYKEGYPKLWIVFEEGSVCGGLSKTGSNIQGVYGIPSSVVSQPGHAAYIYMNLVNGEKVWTLYNDVYGWGESGKTEKLSVRMPNGWGDGSYAGTYPASYILLATDALNDYDNYVLAEEILMLSDIYKDSEVLETIYEKALDTQNINFDAWLNLVNLYLDKNASDEELYTLATRIVDNLKYYPLPMHDLIRLIEGKVENASAIAALTNLVNTTLEEDANLEKSNLKQESAIKQVAKYLLNANDLEIASFSFDGENANKIVLNDRFEDNGVAWQYNLTSNANDWHDANGMEASLSDTEVALIHPETDIMVRIVGALDNVYHIDIAESLISPKLTINDLENTITGYGEWTEWSYDGNEWKLFSEEMPELIGDVTLNVRERRHDTYLESEIITFNFTKDDDEETNYYIPVENLSIESVSSEETEREDNKKENAIDGNPNTMWHTKWDGSDTDKYIVLKLNEEKYLTGLSYVPRATSSNGIVKNAKILVSMDNENWIEVVSETDWSIDNTTKYVAFNEVTLAKYVKVIGVETYGDYMSAAMINLFEDKSRTSIPTAQLEYNITTLTNEDVVVKLVNPSKEIKITNNNGSDTYTFTENGEFTFEFEDIYGNKNTLTAIVDYIDKIAPVAKLTYSTISYTKNPVTVTLTSDEEITILNNDGSNTYTFTENGEFEFIIQDKAGNESRIVAKVDWINKKGTNSNNGSTSNNKEKEPANKPNVNDNKDKEPTTAKDNEKKFSWWWILLLVLGALLLGVILGALIIVLIIKKREEEEEEFLKEEEKVTKNKTNTKNTNNSTNKNTKRVRK